MTVLTEHHDFISESVVSFQVLSFSPHNNQLQVSLWHLEKHSDLPVILFLRLIPTRLPMNLLSAQALLVQHSDYFPVCC